MYRRGSSRGNTQDEVVSNVLFNEGEAAPSMHQRPPSAPQQSFPNTGPLPQGSDNLDFYSPVQPYNTAPVSQQPYGVPSYQPQAGGFMNSDGGGYSGFDDEPPLLEELGINPMHIYQKTVAVLNPFRPVDPVLLEDTDLAGPLVFILLLGTLLVLHGKLHFGYLFGFGSLGCMGVYALVNLMSQTPIGLEKTVSILGYCILPMLLLTTISLVLALRSLFGLLVTSLCVFWCTHTASLMFVRTLAMHEQRLLVAYPVALLYAVFALMTVF